MQLTRADIERIIENTLSELQINVYSGGFTDPNRREVKLTLGDRVISTAYFDIVQTDEYDG